MPGKLKILGDRLRSALAKNWWAIFINLLMVVSALYLMHRFHDVSKKNFTGWLAILSAIMIFMGAVATGLMLNPVIKGSADEAARLAELLDELKRLDNYAPKYFEAVRDLVGIAKNNAIDRRDSSISAMIFFMISIVAIFLGTLFLGLSI